MSRFAAADMPATADVAIVGGGLAGIAAALTLRRYTQCRCVVLEASDYEADRAGESVSPAIVPLLEYLGISRPDWSASTIESYGAEASWGSDALAHRASLFTESGGGWMLERRRFDECHARAAQQAGVDFFRHAPFRAARLQADGTWRVDFSSDGQNRTLAALQLIDATGRRAALACKLGARRARRDRLVCLTAYVRSEATSRTPQTLLVESAPNGWWYSSRIPGDRAVITYLTDADLLKHSTESRQTDRALQKIFTRELDRTLHVAKRHSDASIKAIRVHSAQSHILTPCIGKGWVAAGDAAASHDPISSLGIGHAIASGIQAARIVHRRLNGDEALADAYEGDVARNYATYEVRRRLLYMSEQRWSQRTFWGRRWLGMGMLLAKNSAHRS